MARALRRLLDPWRWWAGWFWWGVLAIALVPAIAQAHAYRPHDPGCKTRACDRRVDEAWAYWEAWVTEPGHPYASNPPKGWEPPAHASASTSTSEPTCVVSGTAGGTQVTVTYQGLKTAGLGPHAHYLATLFAMDLLDDNLNPLPLTYPELQTQAFVPTTTAQTIPFVDYGDGRYEAGLLLIKGGGRANAELSTHCTTFVP